jgi:prepilin-type N-terminal cleavage/methylation domain-containing protein
MKRAFTLLELMVVLVIIGILATIAIPQYFKAIERAHVSEAASTLGAIRGAQLRYHDANGKYTNSLDDLDIEIAPNPTNFFQFFALDNPPANGVIGEAESTGQHATGFQDYSLGIRIDGSIICYGTDASDTKCPAYAGFRHEAP